MAKLSRLGAGLACALPVMTASAQGPGFADVFALYLGPTLVERLSVPEQGDPAFLVFDTMFAPGTELTDSTVVTGGHLRDALEFIADPTRADMRRLLAWCDGQQIPLDPANQVSFRIFNTKGNALPADRLMLFSESLPASEPDLFTMLLSGAGLIGLLSRRLRQG